MHYRAFGLTIDSELPLVALPAEPGMPTEPDVTVRVGPVPAAPPEVVRRAALHRVDDDTSVLEVPRVARYRMAGGREITVEPLPDGTPDWVGLYLTGSAWGALLHQRGLLVMHAGAVVGRSGAVLLVGDSGVGKSTLTHALAHDGLPFLADDITGVTAGGDGRPRALPGFGRTRLWADAAARLGQPVDGLDRVASRRDKYHVPVAQRATEPAPVAAVYELCPADGRAVRAEPVGATAAFELMARNTYRPEYLDDLDVRGRHFESLARVLDSIDVQRIHRPREGFALDELVTFVRRRLDAG